MKYSCGNFSSAIVNLTMNHFRLIYIFRRKRKICGIYNKPPRFQCLIQVNDEIWVVVFDCFFFLSSEIRHEVRAYRWISPYLNHMLNQPTASAKYLLIIVNFDRVILIHEWIKIHFRLSILYTQINRNCCAKRNDQTKKKAILLWPQLYFQLQFCWWEIPSNIIHSIIKFR